MYDQIPEGISFAIAVQCRKPASVMLQSFGVLRCRLLDETDKPGLNLVSPASRLSKSQWGRACRLGRALMSLARRRPYLVRTAVLGYCCAAITRRYVVMTDAEDAEFGKLIIEVVRELHFNERKSIL
jgi:hypothetical protein